MTQQLQLPLGVQLHDGLAFDTFHAGPNAELVAELRRCADGIGARGLTLTGVSGIGMTHLLQATCRAATAAGRHAAYLPLADLRGHGPGILEGMDAVPLVGLDDVHTVCGDRAWESALVSLFDGVRHGGGCVVAASRVHPAELDAALPDLRSRLGWGPVYPLHPLDDAGKRALLRLRARRRGLDMGEDVARYLLNRRARDLPALVDLLDRLDTASLAAQRRLTVPFVRQVLDRDA